MKIILLSNTEKKSFIELKDVKRGYGRYLISTRRAVAWEKGLEKFIKPLTSEERASMTMHSKKDARKDFSRHLTILKGKTIVFQENVSASGRLFGSINEDSIKKYLEQYISTEELEEISITLSNKNRVVMRYIKFPGDYCFCISSRPIKRIDEKTIMIPFSVIKK